MPPHQPLPAAGGCRPRGAHPAGLDRDARGGSRRRARTSSAAHAGAFGRWSPPLAARHARHERAHSCRPCQGAPALVAARTSYCRQPVAHRTESAGSRRAALLVGRGIARRRERRASTDSSCCCGLLPRVRCAFNLRHGRCWWSAARLTTARAGYACASHRRPWDVVSVADTTAAGHRTALHLAVLGAARARTASSTPRQGRAGRGKTGEIGSCRGPGTDTPSPHELTLKCLLQRNADPNISAWPLCPVLPPAACLLPPSLLASRPTVRTPTAARPS